MKYLLVIMLICVCIQRALALRILGIFPYQGKSHFFVFRVYLEELARRGHDVTVVSHFPNSAAPYKDISLAGTVKVLEEDMPLEERSYIYLLTIGQVLMSISADNCEKMLNMTEVQELWKTNQHFDLVVTEQFNSDCSLGVAHKLGAPVVALTSHILFPYHYSRLGIPDNLAFVPFHFIDGGSRPSLWQRTEIAVFRTYFNLIFRYFSQKPNQKTLEKYFGPIPDLDELAREVKFILVYHYFPLTGSRLFPPNIVEVGGYHVAPVKPLPDDIRQFIEESPHGVVYVSFGSLVKTSSISEDKLSAIVDALSSLQQRVIWKWEEDALPGASPDILTRRWLPQNDILAHQKVLAFYSHGGMLSTTEAIHHGVGMVVMPVLGDQPANAASIRESGLGVQLDIAQLSAESLRAALQTVLAPEFAARVRALSRLWRDRPLPPLDAAVFWTEFAARHANVSLLAHAARVPPLSYHSLDLLGAALALALATLALLRRCSRCGRRAHTHNERAKTE